MTTTLKNIFALGLLVSSFATIAFCQDYPYLSALMMSKTVRK